MSPIERLVKHMTKLPGMGPRSARRVVLHLLKSREDAMDPLREALDQAALQVKTCGSCGNLDMSDPCVVCTDLRRNGALMCVVEAVDDLWALERAGFFKGRYHVLGGVLSALDGIGPDQLRIQDLIKRLENGDTQEVILALSATVQGQTTSHYLRDCIFRTFPNLKVTHLAYGLPIGGELNYLDDGTIETAFIGRTSF